MTVSLYPSSVKPLPVTLVVGFARSGKTRTIGRLRQQIEGETLWIASGGERSPLGCICCSGSEQLREALREAIGVHQREHPLARIFIEGDRETDPVPVIRAIRQRFDRSQLYLSETIAAIDVTAYPHPEEPQWLATNHVFFADRVVLTHCDLATAGTIRHCERSLRSIKGVPIVRTPPEPSASEMLRLA